jgi:hypothetical protein
VHGFAGVRPTVGKPCTIACQGRVRTSPSMSRCARGLPNTHAHVAPPSVRLRAQPADHRIEGGERVDHEERHRPEPGGTRSVATSCATAVVSHVDSRRRPPGPSTPWPRDSPTLDCSHRDEAVTQPMFTRGAPAGTSRSPVCRPPIWLLRHPGNLDKGVRFLHDREGACAPGTPRRDTLWMSLA